MSIYDKASLVLIPSGTKTSKVYSQKPVNGDGDFTFSRSTAATRVNADGNIEKETQNLLKYSNTLSNADWVKTYTSVTGGQSGYDGSSDAWLLDITGGTDSQRLEQSVSQSGVQTFSIYAKAGTEDWIRLRVNTSGTAAQSYFDLANGALGVTHSGLIDRKIEDIGNGWYRCSISFNATSSLARVYPAVGNGNITHTSGNIYIQDAQLEQGLVARDYIETTTAAVEGGITDNVPRLDYTDSSCPALLLEPQRTNLVPHSEYTGGYTASGTGTGTDNDETSPEGYTNAFTLNDTSTGAYYRIEDNITLSGGDHTLSVFIKKTTGALSHYAGVQLDTGRKYVIVDTTNGTYNEAGSSDNDSVTIQDWNSDWWRVVITNNIVAGTKRVALWPAISSDGSSIAVGATGENTFYGVQLEAGSYATSYIPTYGSAVTRNAETCSDADTNSTGDYFSVFLDYSDFRSGGINGDDSINFKDSSGSTIFYLWGLGQGFAIRSFSGDSNGRYYAGYQFGRTAKALVRYNGSNIDLFIDGVKQTITSPSTAETNWNQIAEVDTLRASDNKYKMNQFMVFPTALTDEEAIDLTTL